MTLRGAVGAQAATRQAMPTTPMLSDAECRIRVPPPSSCYTIFIPDRALFSIDQGWLQGGEGMRGRGEMACVRT